MYTIWAKAGMSIPAVMKVIYNLVVGKSLIFEMLPLLIQKIRRVEHAKTIIIEPLNSIITEQLARYFFRTCQTLNFQI